MITTRTVGGVQTITHYEGDWQFQRTGWATWTATHVPTGTVTETEVTDLDEARRVALEKAPSLGIPAAAPAAPLEFTVESRFNRRFGKHRQGEPR